MFLSLFTEFILSISSSKLKTLFFMFLGYKKSFLNLLDSAVPSVFILLSFLFLFYSPKYSNHLTDPGHSTFESFWSWAR